MKLKTYIHSMVPTFIKWKREIWLNIIFKMENKNIILYKASKILELENLIVVSKEVSVFFPGRISDYQSVHYRLKITKIEIRT